MDSYIVRFYRRAPHSSQEVVGTVERIGSGERSAFAGQDELLQRLLAPAPADPTADAVDTAPPAPAADPPLRS